MKQRNSAGNGVRLLKPQSLPPSDVLPPVWPHLLDLPKECQQLGTKYSNARAFEDISHSNHCISSAFLQVNERVLNRLHQVQRITRRLQQERRFLMRVLDSYGDDYRASQFTIVLEVSSGLQEGWVG